MTIEHYKGQSYSTLVSALPPVVPPTHIKLPRGFARWPTQKIANWIVDQGVARHATIILRRAGIFGGRADRILDLMDD